MKGITELSKSIDKFLMDNRHNNDYYYMPFTLPLSAIKSIAMITHTDFRWLYDPYTKF